MNARVSPIRCMRTSVAMAGGSLTEDGGSQELAALVEHGLLDHLVRPQQQRLRNGQSESLGRFHVDDKLELRRLLDRKVAGSRASQDFVYVPRRPPPQICKIRTVGHEAARLSKRTKEASRRQSVVFGEL